MGIHAATGVGIIHGSPSGYDMGCRSQGGCPNHEDGPHLTCVDAAAAVRDDWNLRKHPRTEPIPRKTRHLVAVPPPKTPLPAPARKNRASRVKPVNHGTVWGYTRGCRTIEGCPNTRKGRPSCVEERRRYYRQYAADRCDRREQLITHGTTAGYALGCHDRQHCPGDPRTKETCSDAALEADTRRRRARGVAAQSPLTSSGPARGHIAKLQDAGMSIRGISAASGVSLTAIRALIQGRSDYIDGVRGPRHGEIPKQITQVKADQILAVSAPAKLGAV